VGDVADPVGEEEVAHLTYVVVEAGIETKPVQGALQVDVSCELVGSGRPPDPTTSRIICPVAFVPRNADLFSQLDQGYQSASTVPPANCMLFGVYW
jgi:hypothetical protein